MSDKRGARETTQALVKAERALDAGDAASAENEVRAAPGRDERSPEAYYLLGEIARRSGQADAAQRHYRRAIQLDAGMACLHHGLGNALQDAGRLDDAIAAYRRALRLAPQSAEIWNDLGTAYFAAGKRERAADCYRRALDLAPAHVIAAANLGSALRALGEVRGAMRAYWRELRCRLAAVGRSPRRQLSPGDEAERWLRRGSTRMAASLAEAALSANRADAKALAVKAELAERGGNSDAACELLEQALRGAPKDAQLWARFGRVQLARGEHAHAAAAIRKAIALGDRSPAIRRDLALALPLDEELERLARESDDAEIWALLGRRHLDEKNPAAAQDALARALALNPASASALAQLARLRLLERSASETLDLCEKAIEADPACAPAHYWRARAFAFLGKWPDARDAFREAASVDPLNAAYIRWLAVALRETGELDEAQSLLRDALKRTQEDFDLRSELIVTIYESGEVARAREALEKLLSENSQHVRAIAALSGILNAEGRLEEAIEYAGRALALEPDNAIAHQNLGVSHLKRGDYAEGWDHYEWRTKADELAAVYLRFPYPYWDGSGLARKTILVFAEQGLGDEIMFASCIPDLVRQAGRVVLECEPRLGALFRRSFPGCSIFARQRTEANAWAQSLEPQPDVQCAIGSLARHFRRRREDFPRHDGYLRADPAKVERWRTRLATLGSGRKLGLSWRGGLVKTGRMRRSVSLDELVPLLKLPGIQFVSLQYGPVKDELTRLEQMRGIRILHEQEAIDDYDEGAALICALDGVLTVCTSVVHLAGALGRPVLVMAPFSPEWRYRASGEEMPWYPSVRVLRQPTPGDWPSVFAQVRVALEGE